MLNWKSNSVVLFWIIFAYLCLQLPFLSTVRPILFDEPWYANPGYNFSIGKGFHNTLNGSGGNSNFMFPLLIGIFFKILGVSLFTARFAAVFCGVVFIFILFKILNLLNINKKSQMVAFLTLLSVSIFNSIFRTARPECMSMVFVLAAIYFYLNFLIDKRYWSVVWSSIFLTLAFLSHPFSSLYNFLIGFHLLILSVHNRDIKLFSYTIVFGVIALIGLVALVLTSAYYNYNSFNVSQSFTDIMLRTSSGGSLKVLVAENISSAFKFWVFSKRLIFSVPLFIIVLGSFFIQDSRTKILSTLSMFYFILSFFIFKNQYNMFCVTYEYFLCISIIILAIVFDYSIQKLPKLTLILTVSFLLINFTATTSNNIIKYDNTNRVIRDDLKKIIPNKSNVIGSQYFWFFLPQTNYYSTYYMLDYPSINYIDYVITCSLGNHSFFEENKCSLQLIYRKETQQYGVISVFKRIMPPELGENSPKIH